MYKRQQYDIISVGSSEDCDYRISDCHDYGQRGIDFKLGFLEDNKTVDIDLPIPGAHNRYNATLAIAAGEAIGIKPKDAVKALHKLRRTGMRLEFKDNGVIRVMDDSYSSFPEAVRSADVYKRQDCSSIGFPRYIRLTLMAQNLGVLFHMQKG